MHPTALADALRQVGLQHLGLAELVHTLQGLGLQLARDALAHIHARRFGFSPAVQALGARVPRQGAAMQVLHRDGIVRISHHHGPARDR
jgi:hypothetical protein